MAQFTDNEIDDLLRVELDAFLLLAVLRRNAWGDGAIFIPAKMARIMPKGRHERRLFRARDSLLRLGKIEKVPAEKRRGLVAKYHLSKAADGIGVIRTVQGLRNAA